MSKTLQGPLATSDEVCRSMISAMSEGVVLQDESGAIVACNASAERLLGVSAEQMMGSTSLDPRWRAIHPDGSPFPGETHPAFLALRSGRPERAVEMGVHTPDGRLTWVSVNAEPLIRQGETKPYAVLVTFADITARKQAELELRQSEERYRRIIETSLEGIWEIDLEGRTTFANTRMARMLHCTPDELARSNMWDFIDPSDHQIVAQRMQRRGQGIGEEHEFRFVAKDGANVWASLSTCAISLPGGQPGALAMVRDITERRQLLDQLQEARRLEAIGRLAGGVAHDFNNLLTAILTSTTLAAADRSGLDLHLETIRSAAQRAAVLTKQLLAFARKQIIHTRPLLLNTVVHALTSVLQRVVSEQIEVVTQLAPDTWPVLGDVSQLEQVLVNLVANARDAMPDGGRVVISTSQATLDAAHLHDEPDAKPGDYVMLSVSDTGSGIDEATRQHIFEPFFTTKSHGTGLGLASCHGIVKQLGGYIRVVSAANGGSTFEVYLPRSNELPAADAPALAPPIGGRETLLVVEDDELVRRTLVRALRTAGYAVMEATNGEHGLEVAAGHAGAIDLLITDVVMPVLGGRQLAERLHALRRGLQVLFVSGYSEPSALPAHIFDAPLHFLPKPYAVEDLLRVVRELLDAAH